MQVESNDQRPNTILKLLAAVLLVNISGRLTSFHQTLIDLFFCPFNFYDDCHQKFYAKYTINNSFNP